MSGRAWEAIVARAGQSLRFVLFLGLALGGPALGSYGIAADTDHDGIEDALDNCPEVSNPSQANADGDALGDACDLCPSRRGTTSGDSFDPDHDGVGENCDNCTSIANPDQANL